MIRIQSWLSPAVPAFFGATIGFGGFGCFSEPISVIEETSGTSGESGSAGTSGSLETGGTRSTTGESGDTEATEDTTGTGGEGGLIPGDAYIPQISRPLSGQTLAPTRAFLLWTNGTVPAGRAVTGYEVCWTMEGTAAIDDVDECPNATAAANSYHVLDPLAAGMAYYCKVQTLYDEGYFSEYSDIRTFDANNTLRGWWRLDGNASDASGIGNNGVLQNGASFQGGISGQALVCDGIDDYVNLGNDTSLDVPGPLTLSVWIYGDGLASAADSGIINKGDLDYALTYHTNGNAYFYIGDGGNNVNAPVDHDAWHHVVGTFDGTTNEDGMNLYVDGVLASQRAAAFETTGAMGSLSVGRFDSQYFKGLINDVTVHTSALSIASVENEFCSIQALSGTNPLPETCNP